MRMVTRVLEIATVLSLLILGSFLHGGFLLLYSLIWTILAFHLLIIQVYTWVPVPSDTLSGVLWVAIIKVALFRSIVYINVVLAALPYIFLSSYHLELPGRSWLFRTYIWPCFSWFEEIFLLKLGLPRSRPKPYAPLYDFGPMTPQ